MRSLLLKAAAWAKAKGGTDILVRHNMLLRGRAQRALAVLKGGSPDDMLRLTRSLTEHTLLCARKTRYGRQRGMSLDEWPVLTKTELRAHPDHFVSRFAWPRLPAGTGGTTGTPLALWRSLECVSAEQVFIDYLLEPHGFSLYGSKVAVLRADSIKSAEDTHPPYGRISHGGMRLTLSTPHLNSATLLWYHDALMRFAPSVLWVYPSAAGNLLTLLARAKLPLHVPVILASSEELSAGSHEALAEYFQAQVINYYGQAERVSFAASTKPNEFFFNPAYGRIELSTPEALADGSCRARILATGYWNMAMPLVRYDTGDYIYLSSQYGEKDLDEIARGIRPFTGMAGRDNEYVVTNEGLHIIGLNQIPREIENIYQMQLVQTGFDTLQIHVLAKPGFTKKDATRIRSQAKAKLPASIDVVVSAVDRLEVTRQGKTPFVIRKI